MTYFKNFLAGTTTLTLLTFAPYAFAVDEIGINSAVKGDVTVQSGEQAAKQAIIKDPIFLGDEVNSAHKSSLQVLLKDQTVFTVGPDCQLTIDKYIYDPDKNSNSLGATVKKGMFRFMSGNISKSGPESVTIDTPVASMGIRGTMVEGLVGAEAIAFARRAGLIPSGTKIDMDGATLFVLRGPGKRSRARNRKGEISVTSGGHTVTTRRSGYAIFVGAANMAPTKPFRLDADIFDVFNQRLRTEPTGGASFKPFELDPFLTEGSDDRPADDNPLVGDDRDNVPDPGDVFDWPSGDDIAVVPDCTPNNVDYPNCLLNP